MYYVLTSEYHPGQLFYNVRFNGLTSLVRVPVADVLMPSEDEHTRNLNLGPEQIPVRVIQIFNKKDGLADILIPCSRASIRISIPNSDLIDIR